MITHQQFRIFIGFDAQETVAYHVLAASILKHATIPISITPLVRRQLRGLYRRERGPTESTEFSLTRFLVPYLCDYQGIAIFMDCDMLCRVDMADLMLDTPRLQQRAIYVCQHEYTPRAETKFLGQVQTAYPRKNWSSLIVFNCDNCRALSPAFVNEATGLELHRFTWTTDGMLGKLPLEWNWLIGEYPSNPRAKILHWTEGGPWFPEYTETDCAEEWREARAEMLEASRRKPTLLDSTLAYLGTLPSDGSKDDL
jgi:hypothetical protein